MTTLLVPVVLALAGALGWTLCEYLLHNFHGHRARGKNAFSREHLTHHARSGYFTPLPIKLRTAVPVLLGFGVATTALAGLRHGLPLALGFVGGAVFYEILHYRLHVAAPIGAYGRWARRHHFFHHFGDARLNHGVTTPLWDLVFRTYARPGQIAVPDRFAMRWLIDGRGAVRAEHAPDYRVVSRRGGC